MRQGIGIRVTIVGLSLFLLSMAFIFWGGLHLLSYAPSSNFILMYYSVPLCVGFVFAIALLAVVYRRIGSGIMLFSSVVSIVFIVGGMLVTLFIGGDLQDSSMVFMGIGLSFGIGSAAAFFSWEHVFCCLDEGARRTSLLASLLIFPALYLLAIHSGIPTDIFGFMLVFLTAVSGASLLYLIVSSGKCPDYLQYRDFKLGSFLKRNGTMLFCLACVAAIAAITRSIALSDPVLQEMVKSGSMIALLLAGIVAIILFRKTNVSMDYSRIYSVAFPVFATGLVLLPVLGRVYQAIFTSVTFAFFFICSLFAIHQSIDLSKKSGVSAIVIFAVLNGVLYAATGLGTVAGSLLLANNDFGFSTLAAIALVLVYVIAMATTAMNRPKERMAAKRGDRSENGAPKDGGAYDNIDLSELQSQTLAKRASFSKRETEVLVFLSKGRDVPFIAEALYLSKNTIRTHIKNIYRKTGTHDRQELLNLVESVNIDQE